MWVTGNINLFLQNQFCSYGLCYLEQSFRHWEPESVPVSVPASVSPEPQIQQGKRQHRILNSCIFGKRFLNF